MSIRSIKLKFVDNEPGFVEEHASTYCAIAKDFNVQLCEENPDYIIFQPYGHDHLKYDCIKIFFTGENQTPDFNLCDYAIGFDYLDFGDRYVRVPLWAIRSNFKNFRQAERPSGEQLLNRKFCSFVVSNSAGDPIRTKFFQELSKYKKVDSGGYYMNNVGGPVPDKSAFVSQYKFNIAFENSSYPGYTTEKIMDPLSVWSVPIYWGDPLVEKDFRPEAIIRLRTKDDIERTIEEIIRLRTKDDIERTIEEIIRLDKDDAAYLEKCAAPCLVHPELDYYSKQLHDFLCGIFARPLSDARRTTDLGYQGVFYKTRMRKAFKAYDWAQKPLNVARKVKRALKKLAV